MLGSLIQGLVDIINKVGYPGVFAAMFLGNALVPIPVEVVMIPAGYLAQQGKMHLVPLMGSAVAGDIFGSLFAYYVAAHFGRRFLFTYGKYLFFNRERMEMLERFFARHGEVSTLTGRLIPGLRHFMAFPAGLSHMKLNKFIVYTGAGGGLWMGILVWIGYMIGDNKALVKHYTSYMEGVVIAGVVIMIAFYIWHHRRKKPGDTHGLT